MITKLLLQSTKIATLAISVAVTTVTAFVGAGVAAEVPPLLHVEVEGGQDLATLIGTLASTDAHERAMAACEIGRMRETDLSAARDALVGLLGDGAAVESRLCREHENWGDDRQSSPGREAAIALERVGETAIEPLIGVLADGDAVAREHAALALGLIEHERAIGPLGAALGDDVVAVRERAAWALGMIEDEAAIGALGGGLRDASARVREQSAWALGMIEDSAGVGGLVGALRDEDADVREQAAWGLGMIEDSAGVDGLVGALRDEDADVREQAAWGLGMIEDGRAVEALLDAVEDEDAGVRKQALWALLRCVDDVDDADLDYEELAARLRRALKGGGSA